MGPCGSPATPCSTTASARSPTASRSTPPCSTWDACASRSPGRVRYSMTAREAVQLCRRVRPRTAIPVHYEGWTTSAKGDVPSNSNSSRRQPTRPAPPMAAHRRQRQHRRVTTPVVVLEAGVRTPNFAPDGPSPPAETLLRTAVSRHLLARRKPGGSNPLTSTPPLMTSTNAGHLHVRGRAREDGLRRLLKVYKGKSLEARQDTVLIMVLLDTGARRGELVGRKLADCRSRPGRPPGARQGSPRACLAFGHQAALALDRYLHVSDRHKHADLPWLWVGLRGSSVPTVPASAQLQVCLCLRWLPLPR